MTRLAIPALTVIFFSPAALAQPENAPPAVPAAAAPAPVSAEAKAVFDRAIAAYRAVKTYKETVDTRSLQKITGLPEGATLPEPPASTATLKWAGPTRFAYTTQTASIYRDGDLLTVTIPGAHEYTQGPIAAADSITKAVVGILEKTAVPQLLSGKLAGQVFPGVTAVKSVQTEELDGRKGKRVFAVGESPVPTVEGAIDLSIWFADDTGLIGQTVYDLTTLMQKQIDNAIGPAPEPGKPAPARPKAEKVTITLSWRNVVVNPDLPPATFVFTPRPSDNKVENFHLGDEEPAPKVRHDPAPK